MIAEKAKQQQIRKPADSVPQISAEQKPIETRDEIAKVAGVSHDTIDTQFSRRNLDAPERILLAQRKAPILERLARKKQSDAGTENIKSANVTTFVQMDKSSDVKTHNQTGCCHLRKDEAEKLKPNTESGTSPKEPPKPIHVRDEVAKIAGVSSGTVARFEQVQKKKPKNPLQAFAMACQPVYNPLQAT